MNVRIPLLQALTALLLAFLLTHAPCARAEEKYALDELTPEEIVKRANVFSDLYGLRSGETVSISGRELEIVLYNLKEGEAAYYDNIPKSIVLLISGRTELVLPMRSYRPIDSISYRVSTTRKPVLFVEDHTGGNCFNCRVLHVICLDGKHFLKQLGFATGVEDVDGDGVEELIRYEDVWEDGLGYLSHADAPTVRIVLAVKEDRLIPDIKGYAGYYKKEIARINKEIRAYSTETPTDDNARLLTRILAKFLLYRAAGDTQKGWEEFKRDVRHYDERFFYLKGSLSESGVNKIPMEEIIERMKQSLDKRPGR